METLTHIPSTFCIVILLTRLLFSLLLSVVPTTFQEVIQAELSQSVNRIRSCIFILSLASKFILEQYRSTYGVYLHPPCPCPSFFSLENLPSVPSPFSSSYSLFVLQASAQVSSSRKSPLTTLG